MTPPSRASINYFSYDTIFASVIYMDILLKKRKEKFSNLAITIVIIDIFVWDSCTSVETREILVRIIKRSLCKDNALVTM